MAESAAQSSQSADGEPPRLAALLERGWRILEEVEAGGAPGGPEAEQRRVCAGVRLLEEAAAGAAQLGLFSRGEELDEAATADLRFMLLPALLGALSLRRTGPQRRADVLRAARAHFMDFLGTCRDYKVSQFELPRDRSPDRSPAAAVGPRATDLVSMAAQRRAKIERYRQKKELESSLADLRQAVESGQADEEVTREFYLLNIKKWVTVSLEELESIDQELEILKGMDGLDKGASTQPAPPARPPMKPFILTKDALQAQVFGSGYPSLPTMTVDDWYEQHRKHGALPDQGIPRRVPVEEDSEAQEREEEEKETNAEKDDEATLTRARKWDDWKDTHRRGYGNRHNMG